MSTQESDSILLSSVKFDSLGPVIINTDGTLSKIPNWLELTDAEKANTLRVIARRNKQRREALELAAADSTKGDEDAPSAETGEVLAIENNR